MSNEVSSDDWKLIAASNVYPPTVDTVVLSKYRHICEYIPINICRLSDLSEISGQASRDSFISTGVRVTELEAFTSNMIPFELMVCWALTKV